MVRIKVCGITNKEGAMKAVSLGAWALGFIFYKKSPRYVRPDIAKKIIKALPKSVIPVGVFVNEHEKKIAQIIEQCGLKALQFHGDETPGFCKKFKDILTVKAIRVKNKVDPVRNGVSRRDISNGASLKKALLYKTNFLLFDTYQSNLFGGTGKSFDWNLLNDKKISSRQIILSGGLNADNISLATSLGKAYAFDVSSGVEKRPGKKSGRLLKAFFKKVNNKQ